VNAPRQSGYSMVELMVAIAVGLFLTAGIVQIFVANKQTYRAADASARIQENARFALEILARDIRMAGYLGCAATALEIDNNLSDTSSFLYDLETAAGGFESTSSTGWTPSLDASITSALGGSDVMAIRGVFPNQVAVTGTCPAATLVVGNAGGLTQGDIAIVGNCGAATIFQITGLSGTTVAHATGGSSPGNADANLAACFAGNGALGRLSTRAFYIRANPAGVPSLYRTDISGTNTATVELVEGIENMQVLYGVDTGGGDPVSANQYVPANSVADWDDVVSVRIELTLQSVEDRVTTDGQPLERTFTTTLGLRNRLP